MAGTKIFRGLLALAGLALIVSAAVATPVQGNDVSQGPSDSCTTLSLDPVAVGVDPAYCVELARNVANDILPTPL